MRDGDKHSDIQQLLECRGLINGGLERHPDPRPLSLRPRRGLKVQKSTFLVSDRVLSRSPTRLAPQLTVHDPTEFGELQTTRKRTPLCMDLS